MSQGKNQASSFELWHQELPLSLLNLCISLNTSTTALPVPGSFRIYLSTNLVLWSTQFHPVAATSFFVLVILYYVDFSTMWITLRGELWFRILKCLDEVSSGFETIAAFSIQSPHAKFIECAKVHGVECHFFICVTTPFFFLIIVAQPS